MNKAEAIKMLKQALGEIPQLRVLQYDNREYKLWKEKVEQIIKNALSKEDTITFINTDLQIPVHDSFTPATVHQIFYTKRLAEYGVNIEKIIQKYELLGLGINSETDKQKRKIDMQIGELFKSVKSASWRDIESEFGITKMGFGRRFNFITDPFKRTIIFRDVEHSFILASLGFSKPAVILAGSVIEELLRLYLEYKNISPLSDNFDGYIRTCEQNGLLKDSVSRLSHVVRQFRNLVHLSAEETKKHTISKATAIGAVSSIFTIANDF